MSIVWKVSGSPVDYNVAVDYMVQRVDAVIKGTEPEMVWLLEHDPIYTAGTSAKPEDLLIDGKLPVITSCRGGKYTYHGHGQRVVYVVLNLSKRNKCDVRKYVRSLGTWIANTLAHYKVASYFDPDNIGVWVKENGVAARKIAFMGIRVRRGVAYHGVAINVSVDLDAYKGIVPCGVPNCGITSLHELGIDVSYDDLDTVLKREFYQVFGAIDSSAQTA